MSTDKSTAAVVAPTTTATSNQQGTQTIDPTPQPRTNPKNGKPYIFHTLAPDLCTETHDHTLCGRSWKRRYSTRPASRGEYVRQQCPDCAEIKRMQAVAVRRRARAEKLTEFILDALDTEGL